MGYNLIDRDNPTSRNGRGRPPGPTKLTDDRIIAIAEFRREGLSFKACAALVDIDESTLHGWRAQGEVDRTAGYLDTPEVQLIQAVERADAEYELVSVRAIAAEKNWGGRAWLLERRDPSNWGKRSTVEHTGAGGGPIQLEAVRGLTDAELAAELAEAEAGLRELRAGHLLEG